jgi:23S rRNA (cytosine1962-C5)-methyltransferase
MNQAYALLDSGDKRKLEQVGPYLIIRPCAQALWRPHHEHWPQPDAVFQRLREGEGQWKFFNPELKKNPIFPISLAGLKVEVRLTDFGHIGLFPEHHANPALEKTIRNFCTEKKRSPVALHLFAYTGILSLRMAEWGASVVHLDASKTSVAWAGHNAQLSGLGEKPIRWIVDDVKKFVAKENRRGKKYDIIVLDPPSYGRGNKNEIWKLEDDLPQLLSELKTLCSDEFCFLQLSAHSPGLSPLSLENLIAELSLTNGRLESMEMTVPERDSARLLPSGILARFVR